MDPLFEFSCGRFHAMTLDVNFTVWNFRSWGRPFRLVSPSLDCSSPKTTPIQIECGWEFCTVLTEAGDVYVWWPFEGTLKDRYREGMAELDKSESTKAIVPHGGKVIPCHAWEVNKDPVKLPMLPDLPDLLGTGLPEEEGKQETKLIKIAALEHSLIGLTNKGHVLGLDRLYDEDVLKFHGEDTTRTWHYVSKGATNDLAPLLEP